MLDSKLLPKPELTDHPVDVGQRTEAAILSELVRRGYRVLLPWGTNQRYDLVIDTGERFIRAQCKTGRLRCGVVQFPTRSIRTNTRKIIKRGYAGEVELFLVYCPDNRRIYAVPVEEAPTEAMSLRVEDTLNRQVQGINPAKNYELPV